MAVSNIIQWNSSVNLDSDTMLLVFSKVLCPPCKALIPVLNQLDSMIKNQEFKICKVDCDSFPQLAYQFGIRSVPTMIFVHKGNIKIYNQNRDADTIYKWIMSNY